MARDATALVRQSNEIARITDGLDAVPALFVGDGRGVGACRVRPAREGAGAGLRARVRRTHSQAASPRSRVNQSG
jgi:hypothetical protein